MISARLLIVLCGVLASCNLGATDRPLVVVVVAADQPADPADGINVEISSFCGSGKQACLLQVDAIGGALQRPGDIQRVAAFCQRQVLLEPIPILVFTAAQHTEAIVQARLLDGTNEDECEGSILSEAQRAVPARPTSSQADAGAADAG